MISLGLGPGTASGLGGRLGNRLGGWIAESQENLPGSLGLAFPEFLQRVTKSFETEIGVIFAAIHAVKESGEFNQLAACVHEIKVEYFLACHKAVV